MGSGDATVHTLFPILSGDEMSICITRVIDHLPWFGRSWGARDRHPKPGGLYSVCTPHPQKALENQSGRANTMASRVRAVGGGGEKGAW